VENKGHGPLTQTDESLSSSCPKAITSRPAHSMSLSWQGTQYEQLQYQCRAFEKYWLLLAARMINAVSKVVIFQISFRCRNLDRRHNGPHPMTLSVLTLGRLFPNSSPSGKPSSLFRDLSQINSAMARPASSVAEWNIRFSFPSWTYDRWDWLSLYFLDSTISVPSTKENSSIFPPRQFHYPAG
jgi:hypothetical protein